jgi:hypothetical protein
MRDEIRDEVPWLLPKLSKPAVQYNSRICSLYAGHAPAALSVPVRASPGPRFRAHGRIADGGGPKSRLEVHSGR